jgi:alpha-beta hydrolase superfamily lysophospholipase
VRSVALWLGSSDRPLFAWLDVPDDGLVYGAAVICPSMGLEAAYATRGLRHLAHRLVGAGWAALRIDYAATGDSAGVWTDPHLVADWLAGLRAGIDYVRDLGVTRTAVVGLRIGATLAAAELARGGPVDDFVLWDPCVSGRAFLREQTAFSAFRRDLAAQWGVSQVGESPGSPEGSEAGSVEAPGAMFSAATVSDLTPVAISGTDEGLASRELVLGRKGRSLPRALRERVTQPHVEAAEVEDQEALYDDQPVTPWDALDRIADWLGEGNGPLVQITVPDTGTSAVHRSDGRCGVRERVMELGPARLFAMVSEPEDQLEDHRGPPPPTVIFLNVGLLNHHGPDRLWVDLARACASGGHMRCVRVDLNGLGDSPARPGRAELVNFSVDALEDISDIRRAVTDDGGGEGVILVGVCSGADHAVASALAQRATSVCMANPAMSPTWWGGATTQAPSPQQATSDDRPAQAVRQPLYWRLLVRFKGLRRATRWVPNWGWWAAKRWFMKGSPVRTLEQLAQSGVDVLLVSGRDEAETFHKGEHRRLRSLVSAGGVRREVIPHLEHSLLERASRDQAAEILTGYVVGFGTSAGPSADA